MQAFERILVDLDGPTSGPAARVLLGLVMVPAFRVTAGGSDRAWIFIALFFGLLMALRVAPAVLRHALKFSDEAKAIWAERRGIAKRYDSYQWQKLFWIGLGMVPTVATAQSLRVGELIVLAMCLIGGGAGLFLWRRHSGGTDGEQGIGRLRQAPHSPA
jgi:hypothetical protein